MMTRIGTRLPCLETCTQHWWRSTACRRNMFIAAAFDVTENLRLGERNTLAVRFEPVVGSVLTVVRNNTERQAIW